LPEKDLPAKDAKDKKKKENKKTFSRLYFRVYSRANSFRFCQLSIIAFDLRKKIEETCKNFYYTKRNEIKNYDSKRFNGGQNGGAGRRLSDLRARRQLQRQV
jgi:hypothetical protein